MPQLQKMKPEKFRTDKLRYVRRSPLEYSQRQELVLQQWWWDGLRGEWRDVPLEIEP